MKKYNSPTMDMITVSAIDILLSSGGQPAINAFDNLTLDDF